MFRMWLNMFRLHHTRLKGWESLHVIITLYAVLQRQQTNHQSGTPLNRTKFKQDPGPRYRVYLNQRCWKSSMLLVWASVR